MGAPTATTVTASVMVLPFTNYTVTVAASTSAGQGEETSVTIESGSKTELSLYSKLRRSGNPYLRIGAQKETENIFSNLRCFEYRDRRRRS